MFEAIFDKTYQIAVTVIGTCVTLFLGGWDKIIQCLFALMIIDLVTGFIVAYNRKELNSKISFRGASKKAVIVMIVAVAVMFDNAVGNTDMIFRTATCYFYIANEALSVLENSAKLGLPIPKKITEALLQLKDKEELDEEEEKHDIYEKDNQIYESEDK